MSNVFEHCVDQIDRKYHELGHKLGWRFLGVSKNVLDQSPAVALITLNPGGNKIPSDHPWASCENGASYLVESWGKSPPGAAVLQKQLQAMFQKISDFSANLPKDGNTLLEQSLIAHFVPFRSPRLVDLESRKQSFAFGEILWRKILSEVKPRLIICIDQSTSKRLRKLLVEVAGGLKSSQQLPTGWGDCQADIEKYGKTDAVTLLRLPHLSTFKLFSRDQCKEAIDAIFEVACKNL